MPLGGGIQTFGGGGGFSMGPDGQWRRSPAPPPAYTSENALPRAIEQQGGDYDQIMSGYRNLLNSQSPEYGDLMGRYRQLLQQGQQGPALATYGETPEFNEAFANARELSRTGGLSDADQSNLRARGISPIRAVYANAQRNLDRSRSLSGGTGANYNASASRMARELSEQVSGATQNVNAGIAEMVQRGRLTAAPIMGQLGNSASGRRTDVELANASARNRQGENMANILGGMSSLMNSDQARRAQALQGMTSLYGTTPALVNTFGQQVAQNTGLAQNAARNSGVVRRGAGRVGAPIPGY